MLQTFTRGGVALLILAASAPLFAIQAQSSRDAHRIWGTVRTVDGAVHQGFLRWDRNEGSWGDVLDGSKHIPEENYAVWLEANRNGEPPIRTMELRGYKITWEEEDPDFPMTAASGLRFGHLSAVIPVGRDSVTAVLRSGEQLTLSGGSTDMGPSMRDLIVDVPGSTQVDLEWEDIQRVDFGDVPAGATARSPRLYGTVSDTTGATYTGYISWDLDEIFAADTIDGEDENNDDHNIRFADVRSVQANRRSATLALKSGESLELSGTNDVGRGLRGLQLSDPALGMVEIEWEQLDVVRFTEAPVGQGYDSFKSAHQLFGTVKTLDGNEVTGLIRWDADEEWSWEFLDGRSHRVEFKVEFGFVDHIIRNEESGVTATLMDGRRLELDDSNDVDWDNKGVLVGVAKMGDAAAAQVEWHYIHWDDFDEVQFNHVDDPWEFFRAESLKADGIEGDSLQADTLPTDTIPTGADQTGHSKHPPVGSYHNEVRR